MVISGNIAENTFCRVMTMEKRFLITQEGLQIPCILSAPENANIRRIVLGVHGFSGSAGDAIQANLAEEMELFYAAMLRFDFPGHGENPMGSDAFTPKNCMASLLAVAKHAKGLYPEVEDLCIFATGFGAYCTLAVLPELLELPGKVKLVIQTPSVRMDETLLSMIGVTRETFWAMERYTFPTPRPIHVTYRFYEQLLQNQVLTTYPIPMLILHGEDDLYIRSEDISNFHRINELSKLVIIPGTSHRFVEDGAWDMVLDLTRDWFEYEQVLLADCE